jgi:hypothetical protein
MWVVQEAAYLTMARKQRREIGRSWGQDIPFKGTPPTM